MVQIRSGYKYYSKHWRFYVNQNIERQELIALNQMHFGVSDQ